MAKSKERKPLRNNRIAIVLLVVSVLLQGCYLVKQGKGQLQLRFKQVPIKEAVAGETNPKFRRLLAAVPRIKRFAVERLLLESNDNYTGYYATSSRGITFVVTASRKNELKSYTWWFPIIGSVPYKGYFQEEDALALEKEFKSRGFDTWMFAAPAYSSLGWFKDPITSPMLRRGHYNLAATLFHEMTHATLYIDGDGDFNEQLASFVEQQGVSQYLLEYDILSDEEQEERKISRRKRLKFGRVVREYIPKLEKLYRSSNPLETILREREIIFSKLTKDAVKIYPHIPRDYWKFNNARILQYRRYTPESPIFLEIWRNSGEDWAIFWSLVREHVEEKKTRYDR